VTYPPLNPDAPHFRAFVPDYRKRLARVRVLLQDALIEFPITDSHLHHDEDRSWLASVQYRAQARLTEVLRDVEGRLAELDSLGSN
jgi:hypothetical protein